MFKCSWIVLLFLFYFEGYMNVLSCILHVFIVKLLIITTYNFFKCTEWTMYEYKRIKIYRSCFINVCWSTILTWYGYNNTIVCPRFTVSHCVCYFFAILNENTHTSTCQRGTMEYLEGIKFKEFFIDMSSLYTLRNLQEPKQIFYEDL